MKRGLDVFRAAPVLEPEERVESIACLGEVLYVGGQLGSVIQYDLGSGGGAEEPGAGAAKKTAIVRLGTRKPVEQVQAASGIVLALSDGLVHVLSEDIQTTPAVVLCREAKCVCFHTGREESIEGVGLPTEICVSFRKKLTLYTHSGRAFEQRQEFPTSEAATALAWHRSWICAGFRKEYNLYSDRAGVPREICHLDGKVTPQIVVVAGGELLLLIQENVGLFYSLSTQQASPKSTVTWPRKVANIWSAGHYVLGATGSGQVDVFGVRDQKGCQTLTLEGPTVAACSASGGRSFAASEGSVCSLDPIPFERQVQKLLTQARISDALDVLNATFGPGDPQRGKQLSRLHAMAGWTLFKDLQFAQAFQHFTYSDDFRLGRLLAFWRRCLPPGWGPGGDQPGAVADGAPEPCDIADFVRGRLADRQGQDGSSTVSAAATNANAELANAAVVPFLLRQRDALQAQERLPPEERSPALGSEPGALLRAVDAVLLRLLVEAGRDADDPRLGKLLDAGARCKVEDCEAFLREQGRLDVLAHLLKAQAMYGRVLEEWGSLLRQGGSAPARVRAAEIAAEMVDVLRIAAAGPSGAELLRQYVPELLAAEPSAVLPVFSGRGAEGCPLPPDEVLGLLAGHGDLVQGYLEKLAAQRDSEPRYLTQLALMYLDAVAEEKGPAPSAAAMSASPARQRLLRFLEQARQLDGSALLPRVEELGLMEERVALLCREGRHEEALRLLVGVLNDLPRAEVYCRVLAARLRRQEARQGGAADAADAADAEVSVFCAEPPAWARAVVFAPRAAAGGASGDEAAGAPGALPRGAGDRGAAVRPLMLLLRAVLDAFEGSEQRPEAYRRAAAEYREAAIALLMGQAGHPDLPPKEVIGLVPASWPLESLAGYLAKCARLCLHERRASMLEESLSSMAYLKTFGAWAQERSRKVHITGDRCCPVCNRRFVDKDSVGKAFVAYPNGTCVHLQCKDDLSRCPKTGRSFGDNFSVYCHALGTDAPEGAP